ncbi:hypothetical protein C8R42DRAFT_597737, partial [Lentinula raphanica]
SIRPLTIAMIRKAARTANDDPWSFEGYKFHQITVVAHVLQVTQHATHDAYTLDDGTGQIEFRQWQSADIRQHLTTPIQADSYVRAVGYIKDFNDLRYVNIEGIRLSEDPHEIYFHLMEVAVNIQTHRLLGPVRASLAILHVPSSLLQPKPQLQDSPACHTGPSLVPPSQDTFSLEDQFPDIAPVQIEILKTLMSRPDHCDDGLHFDALVNAIHHLGAPPESVRYIPVPNRYAYILIYPLLSAALEELSELGEVFTTCDDQHYQVPF